MLKLLDKQRRRKIPCLTLMFFGSTAVSSAIRGQTRKAGPSSLSIPSLERSLIPMAGHPGSEWTTSSRLSWSQEIWSQEMACPTCVLGETIPASNAAPERLAYGLSLQDFWSTKTQLKGSCQGTALWAEKSLVGLEVKMAQRRGQRAGDTMPGCRGLEKPCVEKAKS